MLSHEQLIEFHSGARQIKEHHWHVHKEPDPPPMLVVRWRDMKPQSIDVAVIGATIEKVREFAKVKRPDSWIVDTQITAPFVIYTCLAALEEGVPLPGIDEMPTQGAPIESIWLAVEGYSIEGDHADEVMSETYMRGDMERDFKTNPASNVIERLTTYLVETSSTGLAEWARVTSAFHKDDGGRIVWHEPLVNTSEDHVIGPGPDSDGFDRLLNIMIPYVTREKLA